VLVATYAERPDLADRLDEVPDVWPEFMHHSQVAIRYWAGMRRDHPELQLVLYDDETDTVLGKGQTVPVAWDGTLEGLPGGVDDALEHWFGGDRGEATALSAVVAMVAASHQGRGLSKLIIEAMAGAAGRAGLGCLIAPVRPSMKSRYPLTPLERYMRWRRADGLLFDSWLRVHERLGAEILAVCPRSMTFEGSVGEWEEWTGLVFPESGEYVLEGALCPIEIDRERDVGRYVEPNVWMRHSLPA
jgi:GNAT superfamily N-acetyltransferase